MKRIFTLLFLTCSLTSVSQGFTKGSVFNYAIGDSIVTSYTSYKGVLTSSGPPTITYRIFTNKSFSSNSDTVFYSAHEVAYTSGTCIGCPAIITSTNVSFYITDLASSAISFTPMSIDTCQRLVDTSFINDCGRNEHHKYWTSTVSCFEAPILEYKIIEGIGIFEKNISLKSNPTGLGWETKLVSYNKGGQRCGVIGVIPSGLAELKEGEEKPSVYPNPSTGDYNLEIKSEGELIITNILGEEIYQEFARPGQVILNFGNQANGIYTLTYKTKNKVCSLRIVKQ